MVLMYYMGSVTTFYLSHQSISRTDNIGPTKRPREAIGSNEYEPRHVIYNNVVF